MSKLLQLDSEKSLIYVRCGLKQTNLDMLSVSEKARLPMLVTPLPMVIEVRELSFSKAKSPIFVTLLGIVIEVSALQSLKARDPIFVIPSGIVIDLSAKQLRKAKSTYYLQFSHISRYHHSYDVARCTYHWVSA